jgi:quercetin dioxygenase-like cupin family protein
MEGSRGPLIKAADMRTFERVPGASGGFVSGNDHGLDVVVLVSTYPPGVGPAEHRHACGEVFVVSHGRGVYTVDGIEVIAEAGDAVVVPPNTWHRFRADENDALTHVAVLDKADVTIEPKPT